MSLWGFIAKRSSYVYLILILVSILCKYAVKCATEVVDGGDKKEVGRYQVAAFNFEHVSDVYAITLWILLGSLAKVGFHLSKKLTEKFPESCLLILLGVVVGGLLYATKLAEQKAYVLNSDTFLLFLLPPIILEAGYFMPNRPFFDNVGTILLFAIVNTLFNTACIGLTLWGFSFTPIYGGVDFEILHCFVFAALISAVDPVAVLATFVEIHVNDMLYIIVFGESLLNDAVSIVLYRLFDGFSTMGIDNIQPIDAVLGAASFLVVAIGGVLIGIVFGVIACFTTKFTEHTPILEPLIILTYSYLAYLTAEMFSTSGILAITFCGMFMKQYVELNIGKKSNATIEYVLKMLSSIMETIIFMFMGLSTVSDHHAWNTGFVLVTLISCSVYRILGVFIFANIANRWRLQELKLNDMLIMSYGGIRGAVAFALALILDESKIPRKKEFVTATIVVVFFTVFVQGTTIGPVVKWLRIKKQEVEEPTMSAKLTNRLIDHVMSAFEDIAGVAGKHALRDRVRTFDRKVFKRVLLREKINCRDQNLLAKFKKIKELNISKMAEDDTFILPSATSMANMRNISISNFLSSGNGKHKYNVTPMWLSEIPTVPDFQILNSQPSKRVDEDTQLHHLLDTAMFDARRNVNQSFRSRYLPDEDVHKIDRKNSRAMQQYHHQKAIYPFHKMIDTDRLKKIKNQKRRSNAGLQPSSADKSVTKPKLLYHQPSEDAIKKENSSENLEDTSGITITIPDHSATIASPQSPETPLSVIPPPWKDSSAAPETPTKANIPPWTLNPDYANHATTTKPDDTQYTPVFDIFNRDERKDSASSATTREQLAPPTSSSTTAASSSSSRTQSEPPAKSKKNSTTRL